MKTTIKKANNISTVRSISDKQLQEVCKYLGWTEEHYCSHQLEEYESFLSRLFFGWPVEMLNEVRYSPIMSGFWKNEWIGRNYRDFLPFAKDSLSSSMWVDSDGSLHLYEPTAADRSHVYDEYLFIHSHRLLLNDDDFMFQYNCVLAMIRRENQK